MYIGIAADPEQRLRQHLGIIKGGAKYTVSHPVECVAAIWKDVSGEYARKAEYQLKHRLTHTDKLRLCADQSLTFSEFCIDIPDEAFEYMDPTPLNEKYALKKPSHD